MSFSLIGVRLCNIIDGGKTVICIYDFISLLRLVSTPGKLENTEVSNAKKVQFLSSESGAQINLSFEYGFSPRSETIFDFNYFESIFV